MLGPCGASLICERRILVKNLQQILWYTEFVNRHLLVSDPAAIVCIGHWDFKMIGGIGGGRDGEQRGGIGGGGVYLWCESYESWEEGDCSLI